MLIPDMLKNAPMSKRLDARIRSKGSALGVGRGRAVAMRARAQAAGRAGATAGGGGVPPVRRESPLSPLFPCCSDLAAMEITYTHFFESLCTL
uniref:Small nuclear ribonucleoprotein SmD3b n=1 Tax=Elaeis guineensis var. tenera TaxID=51953 RepID=A0A8N4IIN3_ELAGV|nr:small nuclear ribonucleoprotein SmD3b [Elaeis guineensis]